MDCREVQQLRADVRESDPVKFAVYIYTALNSCNYVKFFKLVNSASFLNVCILHRYFGQMRACCLQRLRAYVMPGHTAEVSPHFVFFPYWKCLSCSFVTCHRTLLLFLYLHFVFKLNSKRPIATTDMLHNTELSTKR